MRREMGNGIKINLEKKSEHILSKFQPQLLKNNAAHFVWKIVNSPFSFGKC